MSHTPIGVVGLDPATTAIARRLAACGRRVLVHDRQPERRAAFTRDRPAIEIAGSLADIGAECREVVLWRPTLDSLKEELFGSADRPGLAHELQPGALVIDMSPGSPAVPPRVQGALGLRAIGVVDATILVGGPDAALAGRLDLAIGGLAEFVDRAAEILTPLGHLRRTGPLGSARAARTVTASLRAVIEKATREAEHLGTSAGLAPATLAGLVALARASTERQDSDAARLAIDAAAAVTLAAELGIVAPMAELATI